MVTVEQLAEAGDALMNECLKAEKGSVHDKAYHYWTSLYIPGLLDVHPEEEDAINHAILSAFIAGYTLRLTGEEQDHGTS